MSAVSDLRQAASRTRGRAATQLARRRKRVRQALRPFRPLPGASYVHEARWAVMLRRAPVLDPEEFARRTGVKEIEEIVACSLCGERKVQPLFEPHDRKRERWSYHVVRCPSCGYLYRFPGIRPERLGDLYSGAGYSKFLTGHYGAERQRRYRLVMEAFSPLFDDGTGRRLLDFGCGAGLFLDVAHERGFECFGVDLSEGSVAEARKRPSGQNAYYGSPQDVPEIARGGFDVITMWSVLAHLPCPVEDLTTMRSLLKDDGVLLILTVNANARMLKARRERWNGFTPNHLKFYSPTTLPLLLGKAGFAAASIPPMLGDQIATGESDLSPSQQRRIHRAIMRGNQGNMMRAVAFADPGGPERWRIDRNLVRLG